MNKTPEQIEQECERLDGEDNRQCIRFAFLSQDDSKLWPICGKFNATKRAIVHVHRFEKEGGYYLLGLEYALAIDAAVSRIVNNQK